MIEFPPFRLDPLEQRLWRGQMLVRIKPMAFALLCHLLERAGHLITREELLASFWGDVCIGEGVLKTHIAEIRLALGDRAREARFVETVHGHGYRFIGCIERQTAPREAVQQPVAPAAPPRAELPSFTPHLVGRQVELDFLSACWARAKDGERQMVFVTGDMGSGKSALVNAFLQERRMTDLDALFLWGQCVDQCGSSEPYLPIIEAIDRACADPAGGRIVECLRRNAPAWLARVAASPSANSAPEPKSIAAAPILGRLLGQTARALEALSAQRPTVLLVEDLQWADSCTSSLLAYVAQRSDPARLLVIGTYRPLDAAASRLVDIEQTLSARHRCVTLPMRPLSQTSVREYLDRRFTNHRLPAHLPVLLHERTQGNALLMSRFVDEWSERRLLATKEGTGELATRWDELVHCIPEGVVRMVHRAIERVSPLERSILEAASVACTRFSAAAVAAALSLPHVLVEELCMRWAHRGEFLRSTGGAEWSGGALTETFEFIYPLYQHVILQQIGAARKAQLHLRTNEPVEAAHAGGGDRVNTELAVHFERSKHDCRAVRYLPIGGERSARQRAVRTPP